MQVVTETNEDYLHIEILTERPHSHPMLQETIIADIRFENGEIVVSVLNNTDNSFWI